MVYLPTTVAESDYQMKHQPTAMVVQHHPLFQRQKPHYHDYWHIMYYENKRRAMKNSEDTKSGDE
jgi:hypothetical protein